LENRFLKKLSNDIMQYYITEYNSSVLALFSFEVTEDVSVKLCSENKDISDYIFMFSG